jgi:recombinational DNA repair ATPase RecF
VDPYLHYLLVERLASDNDLQDPVIDIVLAACEGQEALAAQLVGEGAARSVDAAGAQPPSDAPGVYLASMAVTGFRGIGRNAELEVTPGPGLTLVVGRNGSGKSSFAEGLELLMTGQNFRWAKRTRVWTQGWQNLHCEDDTELRARFVIEGREGQVTAVRAWSRGAPVEPAGELALTAAGGQELDEEELGWTAALARYRPFLSYNELGQMFDELKTMYDALALILGLEDVDALHKLLRDERLARERAVREVRIWAQEIREGIVEADEDDRLSAAREALSARTPDVEAVELLLAGVADVGDPAGELALLRSLCSLMSPDPQRVDSVLAELAAAQARTAEIAGTDAARAAGLAELLDRALAHHERHGDDDCPVCGSAGVLTDEWHERTGAEAARLREEARAVTDAAGALATAERAVADLLAPDPPEGVARAEEVALDVSALVEAWRRWAEVRTSGDHPAVREALRAVDEQIRTVARSAQSELDRREDRWRPIAAELREWLPEATEALTAGKRLADLKTAEAWARQAAADLQAERLAPIAQAAKANWEILRQESNVSLEGFHLRKSGNVRAAEVDVRVDGSEASAFGVMSQGELHALAVSVFLPRAALPQSPFRFIVIDDPVQSMDPAKVDGLARVLHEAARDRQVLVFTHDERLPEAVRRLNLSARVLEVTRRPGSLVEVRAAQTPVERYIADARALLKEDAPAEVAERVVPGFCRHALEAACVEAVRRRRLARGEHHAAVEAELARASKLYSKLSLALFDDAGKGSQVVTVVNNR